MSSFTADVGRAGRAGGSVQRPRWTDASTDLDATLVLGPVASRLARLDLESLRARPLRPAVSPVLRDLELGDVGWRLDDDELDELVVAESDPSRRRVGLG